MTQDFEDSERQPPHGDQDSHPPSKMTRERANEIASSLRSHRGQCLSILRRDGEFAIVVVRAVNSRLENHEDWQLIYDLVYDEQSRPSPLTLLLGPPRMTIDLSQLAEVFDSPLSISELENARTCALCGGFLRRRAEATESCLSCIRRLHEALNSRWNGCFTEGCLLSLSPLLLALFLKLIFSPSFPLNPWRDFFGAAWLQNSPLPLRTALHLLILLGVLIALIRYWLGGVLAARALRNLAAKTRDRSP